MAQRHKVDFGVYHQAPLFHFFRNGCVPALSALVAKEFKNANHVKYLLQNAQLHGSQNTSQRSRPQQLGSIRSMNLFEFLKMVHQKGKKKEQKNKKEEQIPNPSKTLHLNNLNDNKDVLSKVNVSQLLDTTLVCDGAFENLNDLDVTFLLNFLTNDILQFPLDDKVSGAVNQMKEIRNDVFHSGSSFKHSDVLQKLDILYYATEVIHSYLDKPKNDIQRMKQEYLKESESISHRFLYQVLEDLKHEVHQSYRLPQHYILPSITHFGADHRCITAVESLEKFILEHKADLVKEMQPILVCGAPGGGKTSLMQNLAGVFHPNSEKSDFLLVLYLETRCRIIKRPSLWELVYEGIENLGPRTVSRYGIEIVKSVINTNAEKILFLADWNLQCLMDSVCDMPKGTWVITYQGTPEISVYWYILKVLPLNETQVEQILRSISHDEERLKHILKLYEECNYKGLLNSPDMVNIFIEIGNNVPFNKMLQHFINRKVNIENRDNELLKLGKTAFDMIKKNGRFYTDKDLSNIQNEVRDPFLEYHDDKGATFNYRVIEDFLAAKYVVTEPSEACKKWLNQVPLFKRVFRFASILWCMSGQISQESLLYMKSYLMKFFDIGGPETKGKRSSDKQKSEGIRRPKSNIKNDREEGMDVDASEDTISSVKCQGGDGVESSVKSQFLKWPFLVTLAEDCQYHQPVVEMLMELLLYKRSWQFKCKLLDESKIEKIARILNRIKLKKTLIVKLESGSNVEILIKLWKMLSSLRGLHNATTVQIMVIHKDSLPPRHKKKLKTLSGAIASIRDNPLYITAYEGPLVCSETPQFLKCACLKKVEVLDVCVCDVASLHEILSCTGLSCLKDAIVKVDLKADEQALAVTTKIVIPEAVPLTLTIKYFEQLQDLLDNFESPYFLKSLSIHDIYIHEKFRLDLSKFTELTSLFMRFMLGANSLNATSECPVQEFMEVDENLSNRIKMLPPNEWTFILAENLTLPNGLERLLLRNMEFYSDSTSFLLMKYWKNSHIQRLMILDSSLSITEVRKILRHHIPDSNLSLEQVLKKCKIDRRASSLFREWISKNPRLEKKEREEKRRNKPEGKELIITSGLGLCNSCKKFPCSCQHGKDNRETLEELVCLIEDTYRHDILSFSFTSEIITVRKDLCGDVRVHCPLTCLDDYTMFNLEKTDPWLHHLFRALTLAQCVCLSHTNLTHTGAVEVVKTLKQGKVKYSDIGYAEPFALTILSAHHPKFDGEVINSTFIDFIREEECLVQFNFCCCCDKRCHHIKKTRAGQIYFNDELR